MNASWTGVEFQCQVKGIPLFPADQLLIIDWMQNHMKFSSCGSSWWAQSGALYCANWGEKAWATAIHDSWADFHLLFPTGHVPSSLYSIYEAVKHCCVKVTQALLSRDHWSDGLVQVFPHKVHLMSAQGALHLWIISMQDFFGWKFSIVLLLEPCFYLNKMIPFYRTWRDQHTDFLNYLQYVLLQNYIS